MRAARPVAALTTCAVLGACGPGDEEISPRSDQKRGSSTTTSKRLSARFIQRTIFTFEKETLKETTRGAFDWTAKKGWAVESDNGTASMKIIQIEETCYRWFEGKQWERSVADDIDGLCDYGVFGNPKTDDDLFRQVADEWQRVGEDRVRGVSTTHYRGWLNIGAVKGPLDIWVDGHGFVRRSKQRGPERDGFVSVRDYYDFGVEVDVKPPK